MTELQKGQEEKPLRERVDHFRDEVVKMLPQHWRRATGGGRDTHVPLFHFLLRNGQHHVIGTAFETVPDKEKVAAFVRQYGRENDVIAIAFISEGWMAVAEKGDDADALADFRGTPPSLRPDRIEVLMCNVETPFDSSMDLWKIHRTGELASLVKDGTRTTRIESRFFGVVEKIQ